MRVLSDLLIRLGVAVFAYEAVSWYGVRISELFHRISDSIGLVAASI